MPCKPKNNCNGNSLVEDFGPYAPCVGYIAASLGMIVPIIIQSFIGFQYISPYKQFDSSSFSTAIFLFIFAFTIVIPMALFLVILFKNKNTKIMIILSIAIIVYTLVIFIMGIVTLTFNSANSASLADVPLEERQRVETERGCCFINSELTYGKMIFSDCPLFEEPIDINSSDCTKMEETYCCNADKMEIHPPLCEDEIIQFKSQTVAIGIIELIFVGYVIVGIIGLIKMKRDAKAFEMEGVNFTRLEEENKVIVPPSAVSEESKYLSF